MEEFRDGLNVLFRKNGRRPVPVEDVKKEFSKSFAPSEVDALLSQVRDNMNMCVFIIYCSWRMKTKSL